ncbi:MAG: hypothetical protein NXI25_02955 [bacterium]|nr:hypothetical protein [bacterium]
MYAIAEVVIPASSGAAPWSVSAFTDILLPDFATWGRQIEYAETIKPGRPNTCRAFLFLCVEAQATSLFSDH